MLIFLMYSSFLSSRIQFPGLAFTLLNVYKTFKEDKYKKNIIYY